MYYTDLKIETWRFATKQFYIEVERTQDDESSVIMMLEDHSFQTTIGMALHPDVSEDYIRMVVAFS